MQGKNETNIKGIDVSKWQGEINWNQVASDGVKYAFIKATEGTSLVDRKLNENTQGANRAGIKVGYYHFAHPDMSPQDQANHFLKSILNKELAGFPLWVAHYGTNQPMANPTWSRWDVFQYSDCGKVAGIKGNVDMNCMEKDFWDAIMKEETTMDRMLADEIILVLKTQWKVSDAMGMKEQAKYLGELADRVRIASGQEPQNK
ncbi:hypothetical protein EEL31_02010 [Brevibacillus laterosporus]|nr:GH25 family lysozyme [Brevibacillus laterosporus]TPG73172.1 hypothetical protein EEL31_02010 [Brevibacillus laterosporus]